MDISNLHRGRGKSCTTEKANTFRKNEGLVVSFGVHYLSVLEIPCMPKQRALHGAAGNDLRSQRADERS